MYKIPKNFSKFIIYKIVKFPLLTNSWNTEICKFLKPNFGFPYKKISRIFFIFQIVKFWKFINFPIYKITKNFSNFIIVKSSNFGAKFCISILKEILEIHSFFNLQNSEKFLNFYTFENHQISISNKIMKKSKFWNCPILKMSEFSKFDNLENY